MNRIAIPTPEKTLSATQPLLDAVKQQLGVIPNLMRMVGNSPAALEGYLSLNGALGKGAVDIQVRERIALAVAEFNGCDYCLAAHSYLGTNVAKLSDSEISAARDFHSADAKANAALKFAHRVLADRGRVSDADVTTLRAAGYDDGAVVEIVLNVALNVLTNYVNNVAKTDIDFPKVEPKHTA